MKGFLNECQQLKPLCPVSAMISLVLLVQRLWLILAWNRSASFAGMLVVSTCEMLHSLHLEHFSLMIFNDFFFPELPLKTRVRDSFFKQNTTARTSNCEMRRLRRLHAEVTEHYY